MLMKTRHPHLRSSLSRTLAALAMGLLVGTATADSQGPNIIEDNEDASNVPSEAKKTKGSGSLLLTLAGSLDGQGGGFTARGAEGDYQDLWLIYIEDPSGFNASTVPGAGGANFDTRLFLFRPDGRGLLYADNSEGTLQTFLGNEASGGGLKLDVAGIYCLGIAGSPVVPRTGGDIPMFPPVEGDQIAQPTDEGLAQPITGWDPFVGAIGDYVIRFNGVRTIPFACGEGGDCYRTNPGPGCADLECCTKVGLLDPHCVDTAWDLQCANLARTTCFSCGAPSAGDCSTARPTPYCSDGDCCRLVCESDPSCCFDAWDAGCVGVASEVCSAPCDPDCPEDFNGDGVRNGADLGLLLGNWGSPGCTDLDQSGSTDGADIGLFLGSPQCSKCGKVESGGCFVPNKVPGCDEANCCKTVCDLDPACCQDSWDKQCAAMAKTNCAPSCGAANAGSCLVAHPSPGCSDQACCTAVCNVYPRCCVDFWDQVCVDYAGSLNACQP